MSDRPSKHAELLLLCGKVRDDTLAAEDAARLDTLLQDSDEAKALYVRYMSVVSLLESRGDGQRLGDTDAERAESIGHDVLAELLQLEQKADAELVHQVDRLQGHDDSPWRVGGVIRWVIDRPAVLGGIAAVLALALMLVAVFSGPGNTPSNVPTTATATPQNEPVVVATLTASHNDQWAQASLARGSELHAGDRLTLTAGFAEITTNEGAVAMLEAPCTIQFTESSKVLHLHAGKLVGVCETDSSKGLLVRTPHMDITDLGTRFGVDADSSSTLVHVYEGEVQAARPDAPAGVEPTPLIAGQSARTSADTIVAIDHDPEPFAKILVVNEITGTGVGLAVGQADPNWRVVAIDGKPLVQRIPLKVIDDFDHVSLIDNNPATAQWVVMQPGQALDNQLESYTIQTEFLIPEHLDLERVDLVAHYYIDDLLERIRINGSQIYRPADYASRRNKQLVLNPDQAKLHHGINTVSIDISNKSNTPVGLHLAFRFHETN
ncbi:MAG: FecR family protein [Phycisphaeraceae bacterium]|nr:FecR family protein [Phycisphaeraceae bacterium]